MQPLVSNTFEKWVIILTAVVCDLAVLSILVLCVWSLRTKYWFVVLLILVILATQLATARSSTLVNDQD